MVVEIPRFSNGKFEISKEIPFNPISQDVKKGKVRFVNNIFPFRGYIHNYGAIPQTWEDPTSSHQVDRKHSLKGDNDPLDCCEIGSKVFAMGDIKTVKILGSLALIDDGELDWKVIVINVEDPLASRVNTLQDVDIHFPGILGATKAWFRDYKIPAGKPSNKFAFDGQYKGVSDTIKIIESCHESWTNLVSGNVETNGVILPQIKKAGQGVFMDDNLEPDSPIPSEVDKWFYIKK